jgi:hypothetical protein
MGLCDILNQTRRGVMKRIIVLLVALIVVFLVCTAESCGDTATDLSGDNNVYTLAMFNKVKNGMSYSKVDSIMGGGGSQTAETSIGGSTMASYSYQNPDGSNAMFEFEDDALYSKAQFGLK